MTNTTEWNTDVRLSSWKKRESGVKWNKQQRERGWDEEKGKRNCLAVCVNFIRVEGGKNIKPSNLFNSLWNYGDTTGWRNWCVPATNIFPYHHNETYPSVPPPPVIRLLFWKWIERRQGTLSMNENCQKWSFKGKKSRVHLNSNVTTSDQIRLLRDHSNKKCSSRWFA